MVLFTHNVEKIKGATHKNGDIDHTCKRTLRHLSVVISGWRGGCRVPDEDGVLYAGRVAHLAVWRHAVARYLRCASDTSGRPALVEHGRHLPRVSQEFPGLERGRDRRHQG